MIKFLILLPFSFLILNLWLWLFDNIFWYTQKKYKYLFILIIIWLIAWFSIYYYSDLLWIIWYDKYNFINIENINNLSIFLYFWLYCSIILMILYLIVNWKNITKLFIINYIMFSFLFIIIWYIFIYLDIDNIYKYYIFVAIWEEMMKFMLWINFYEKRKISSNDILLFSILSALWFAFIENVVYLFNFISWEKLFSTIIIWWFSLILARWLIGFIAHIIFTWNIWLINSYWITRKKLLKYSFFWILFWISTHYIYNISLEQNIWIVIPIIIILWYFWISYLFYKSDRMYLQIETSN